MEARTERPRVGVYVRSMQDASWRLHVHPHMHTQACVDGVGTLLIGRTYYRHRAGP